MTIPNALTLFRLCLVPVLFITFYLPVAWGPLLSAIIFALAALTDWLDGYLARTLHQTSAFGQFLDPVADKLIVIVTLLLLVSSHHFPFITLPAIIIVCRELTISALREWMAEIGKRASVAVSYIGKVKTALQMASLIVLLLARNLNDEWLKFPGIILLYVAALLTLWSMIMYLKAAWPTLLKPVKIHEE